MFRLFFLLISLIFISNSFACDKKDTITIGWDPFAPYQIGNEKTTHPTGIVFDLLEEAAAKVGCVDSIHYVYLPWKRALLLLENGKIDIVANGAKTPEREKFAYFKRYFLRSSNAIFVNKNEYKELNKLTFEQLLTKDDFIIGYTHAYMYGDIFEKMKAKYPKKFEMAMHDDLSITKAFNSRVNAFIGDVALSREMIKDLKEKRKIPSDANFEPLKIALTNVSSHAFFMYSKRSMPEDLVNKFDNAFLDLYKEGTTEKIFLKYMSKIDTNFYLVEPDYEN